MIRSKSMLLISASLIVIALTILTFKGINTDSSELVAVAAVASEPIHDGSHEHDHMSSDSVLTLDQRALNASEIINTAQQSSDIMTGVKELLSIIKIDSNHVLSLEILADLSIQSGQLEKAIVRYEKLLSLRPDNESYRTRLKQLCEQVGRKDCV